MWWQLVRQMASRRRPSHRCCGVLWDDRRACLLCTSGTPDGDGWVIDAHAPFGLAVTRSSLSDRRVRGWGGCELYAWRMRGLLRKHRDRLVSRLTETRVLIQRCWYRRRCPRARRSGCLWSDRRCLRVARHRARGRRTWMWRERWLRVG